MNRCVSERTSRCVHAVRERKTVLLNLGFMSAEEAQRSRGLSGPVGVYALEWPSENDLRMVSCSSVRKWDDQPAIDSEIDLSLEAVAFKPGLISWPKIKPGPASIGATMPSGRRPSMNPAQHGLGASRCS